jgi:SET domain-containing protein
MSNGNDHLIVKRSATGLGLFARRAIAANKRIVEFTGRLITTEERNQFGGRYLFELDEHRAIDGKSRSNIARYANHSCRPNAIAYISGKRIWIWSRRAIEAGEEITIDYGKEYFDQYIRPLGCKCERCASKAKAKTPKKRSPNQ